MVYVAMVVFVPIKVHSYDVDRTFLIAQEVQPTLQPHPERGLDLAAVIAMSDHPRMIVLLPKQDELAANSLRKLHVLLATFHTAAQEQPLGTSFSLRH